MIRVEDDIRTRKVTEEAVAAGLAAKGESTRVALLTVSHGFSDFYATVFTPLFATFQSALGVSLAQMSLLPAFGAVFNSMIQPLFGLLGDRMDRWLLAGVGMLLSALFAGLLGFAGGFWTLAVLLMLSGLGVAAFHPAAGSEVTRGFKGNPASTMSAFLTGGSVGLALAPLVSTRLVQGYGIQGLWVLSLPGCLLGIYLILQAGSSPSVPRATRVNAFRELRELAHPGHSVFWIHWGAAIIRSFVVVSFNTYVSVIALHKGWDKVACGSAMSFMFLLSTVGLLVGGYASSRWSAKGIIFWSSVAACPFYVLFVELGGIACALSYAMAGFVMALGTAVNVVEAQKSRPSCAGVISGAMMGFAWGVAALLQPAVAFLAEIHDIEYGLECAALAAVVGGFVVLLLEEEDADTKSVVPATG